MRRWAAIFQIEPPLKQDRSLISLFTPKRVLELIRYFILFDANIKKNMSISAIFRRL